MHFEKRKNYVLIHAEGEVNTFGQFVKGTKWMYSIIEKTATRKVLLDYRDIFFNLGQTEAFNIVRIYEHELPLLRGVKIASLIATNNKGLAEVWEDIGRKRGFNFHVFTDFIDAEIWLKK